MEEAKENRSERAGRYMTQPTGYRAFIPRPLPPVPPIKPDDELLLLLAEASTALGRLDGSADLLPNPDLFVAMYVRKEAVISSQIEGTQASLMWISSSWKLGLDAVRRISGMLWKRLTT